VTSTNGFDQRAQASSTAHASRGPPTPAAGPLWESSNAELLSRERVLRVAAVPNTCTRMDPGIYWVPNTQPRFCSTGTHRRCLQLARSQHSARAGAARGAAHPRLRCPKATVVRRLGASPRARERSTIPIDQPQTRLPAFTRSVIAEISVAGYRVGRPLKIAASAVTTAPKGTQPTASAAAVRGRRGKRPQGMTLAAQPGFSAPASPSRCRIEAGRNPRQQEKEQQGQGRGLPVAAEHIARAGGVK